MSQQQKLEKVLDLLLSEDSERATELLHRIIVEKARSIYESIVDEDEDQLPPTADAVEEEDDEVGGEPDADFTDEIASDQDEIDSDEESDGEPGEDDDAEMSDDGFGDEGGEGTTEERVEDLESQLAELRAEFDELMAGEMDEPEHADMADEFGDDMGDEFGDDEVAPVDDMGDDSGMPDFNGGASNEKVVGEVVARTFEAKKKEALKKAPEAKKGELKKKGEKKVDEETKFLNAVADTGQRGTAKLVGTGKDTPLGAEQNQSPYTHAPSKKDYGGGPAKIGGGTGGEYGKYNGASAASKTPSDNVGVKPKNSSIKADTTAKYTGGKAAGEGFAKSPLTKKPA